MKTHQIEWQRSAQPALSAMTTRQDWCRVTLYNPCILHHDGLFRMWYLGNSTATRIPGMDLGYAESEDGIHWREHDRNPIQTSADLPFGDSWQTPHVLFDEDLDRYRMWFVAGAIERHADGSVRRITQELAYAESPDGLAWDIRPEPLYPSGRRPCVIKDGPNAYRMWMNSAPHPDDSFDALVSNIWRFTSADGLTWIRDDRPAVTTTDKLRSVVYPFVLAEDGRYTMWYGCHVEGGFFEIYCSTSSDGLTWTPHHEAPSFPATRDPNDFDGRYTSTPCVIRADDRLLMVYSTRDCGNLYGAGDGSLQHDGQGIYRHIGVALG